MNEDPNQRVRSFGKQVMLDGRHLADAVSIEAAKVIVICLNSIKVGDVVNNDEAALLEGFFA